MKSSIYVTQFDLTRLNELIRAAQSLSDRDLPYLDALEAKLEAAHVVAPRDIPNNVVTMNSRVLLAEPDGGRTGSMPHTYTLVFPQDADPARQCVSVLAPFGAALLGGEEHAGVEWETPSGMRRMIVQKILYQPEASSDFHR